VAPSRWLPHSVRGTAWPGRFDADNEPAHALFLRCRRKGLQPVPDLEVPHPAGVDGGLIQFLRDTRPASVPSLGLPATRPGPDAEGRVRPSPGPGVGATGPPPVTGLPRLGRGMSRREKVPSCTTFPGPVHRHLPQRPQRPASSGIPSLSGRRVCPATAASIYLGKEERL